MTDHDAAEKTLEALEAAEDDRARRELRDVLQRYVALGILDEEDIKSLAYRA